MRYLIHHEPIHASDHSINQFYSTAFPAWFTYRPRRQRILSVTLTLPKHLQYST